MGEKKKGEKNFTEKKGFPKSAAIATFWGLGLLLATVLILHHNPLADQVTEQMKKVSGCVLIAFTCTIFTIYYDRIVTIPVELFQSRGLIWKLAKNDFKKRYAGSYLGMVWALAQPVVTVLMYWIVFDKVFQARVAFVAADGVEPPYVLYLMAGLVPWFYFSEAISQGTMALVEYTYLVKKVVFNISILPIIKVVAATFIHVFFCGDTVGGCGLLRVYAHHLYRTASLLQPVSGILCAGAELPDKRSGCFYQGSAAGDQHCAPDRHVGDPHYVEYQNAAQR